MVFLIGQLFFLHVKTIYSLILSSSATIFPTRQKIIYSLILHVNKPSIVYSLILSSSVTIFPTRQQTIYSLIFGNSASNIVEPERLLRIRQTATMQPDLGGGSTIAHLPP
jgi:hypothetical protein